jgi:hypothetical protein
MDANTSGQPRTARRNPGASQRRSVAVHLSTHEVVSYIDRTANRRSLVELEHHLSLCEACRREVIEVTLFLRHRDQREGPAYGPV